MLGVYAVVLVVAIAAGVAIFRARGIRLRLHAGRRGLLGQVLRSPPRTRGVPPATLSQGNER
jgi:hypothetical protein